MKAVIVDLLNGQAAALCDDGRVVRLNDAGYALGQVIEVHEQKRRRPGWTRLIASVAAAAVLLMGVGGAAYAMPYGVVSLDVNPSIEYTINCFRYVLSVEGVNEDGKALLAEMGSSRLVHRRIDDALEESLERIEAGDWLAESGDVLLAAGVGTEPRSERLVRELANGLQAGHGELEIHTCAVSEEDIDAARAGGISPGRQHMLRAFSDRDGLNANPEDWNDRPIGELLRAQENGLLMNPQSAPPEPQGEEPPAEAQQPQTPPERSEEPIQRPSDEAPREQQPPAGQSGPQPERETFDFPSQESPDMPQGGGNPTGGQPFGEGGGFGGGPGAPPR